MPLSLLLKCVYLDYKNKPRASQNKSSVFSETERDYLKLHILCDSFRGNKYHTVVTKSCLVKITCDV